jgi:X breakpoint 2-interacting protein
MDYDSFKPLGMYLDGESGRFEHEQVDPVLQTLYSSMKQINTTLMNWGMLQTGDLFSSETSEISKTIACLNNLITVRQRDFTNRNELYQKIQYLEAEKSTAQQHLERALDLKNELEAEVGRAQNQLRAQTNKFKQEKDKLLTERDDLRRELTKLTHKDTQYQHDLKKKETNFAKLQEQLRKALGEKDLPVKNTIEVSGPLQQYGPRLYGKSGDSEFSYMISRGYEEAQNRLLVENQELRNAFQLLQKELVEIMKQRREALHKKLAAELGEDPKLAEFDLNLVKPEIFNLPFQNISEEVIQTFQENMRRFREFLDKTSESEDFGETDSELSKIKSISELKQLLSKFYTDNYRVLVKNQETLIQKTVLGSRAKPTENITYTASRLKASSDKE